VTSVRNIRFYKFGEVTYLGAEWVTRVIGDEDDEDEE
jgi:hypothetical protein